MVFYEVFQRFSSCWSSWCYLGPTWPPRRHQDPPRHLQEPPRRSQEPPRRPQNAFKTPSRACKTFVKFPPSLSDMPSLCQVRAKSLPDCQIRQRCMSTMVKHNGLFCEGRGRLPRVVWRWFARVGRLRLGKSARPPW